jgi:hypothetical protein
MDGEIKETGTTVYFRKLKALEYGWRDKRNGTIGARKRYQ